MSLLADKEMLFCYLLKWVALSFKHFCIEKDSHMDAIEHVNDALLFQNKENIILFRPPKKAQRYERFVYTSSPWPGYSLGRDWADWVIRTTK